MIDREKVIRGLECLAKRHGIVGVCEPESCPYGDLHTCANEIARDVLTLLKAQEPRVMTLEEVHLHEVYWIEEDDISRPWPTAMHHIRNAGLLDGPVYQDYMGDNWNTKEYGKTWRVWTSRPTDKQREAEPWN